MKELYGLFVKMEREQPPEEDENSPVDLHLPLVALSPQKQRIEMTVSQNKSVKLPALSPNQTANKFSTPYVDKKYNHKMASIENEQFIEDTSNSQRSQLKQYATRLENSIGKTSKLENSIGKTSNGDQVDDLIKWAKDLPDDVEISAGQSFYRLK